MSIKLRFSVTCILYRRKLPDITQVLNVYVIHIKFLQNASFLRKLNPLNFAVTVNSSLVRTVRNWPVINIFSVRTIWIADKLPNISEDKKNSISTLSFSQDYLRYRDTKFSLFSAQTMPEYCVLAELSRPDIGEHKFRQKLEVGKWKKKSGFWCSKK